MPDLSIEVDDLEAVIAWVRAAGIAFEYGPVDEPWGVRRFLRPRSFWTSAQHSLARSVIYFRAAKLAENGSEPRSPAGADRFIIDAHFIRGRIVGSYFAR